MRWITQPDQFSRLLVEAKRCAGIGEAGQDDQLVRMVFDSSELCTVAFANLLQKLMRLGQDSTCYYLVLSPDPVAYFSENFKKYPLIEIQSMDSAEEYLGALNEDPGDSPADAIGINWSEYVVVAPSRKWFVRAIRDDWNNTGGHLFVPSQWVDEIAEAYPAATREPSRSGC